MKTKKQIQNKIKETKEKMKDPKGGVFIYWLGCLRTLQWILEDHSK
jgi:hypothetical protein